jgi:hypothetical protein
MIASATESKVSGRSGFRPDGLPNSKPFRGDLSAPDGHIDEKRFPST